MSATPPLSDKLYDADIDPRFFSFRTFLKYAGPGWLMSLAFIDPGNIEADLQAGAFTGFKFLWVILLAHVGGLILQTFASRLGVVSGQGLARVCRDNYPHYLTLFLWLMAELAIIGSDVQEVIGSSIALNLLFGWPLWVGVVVTGLTTIAFLVLYLYRGSELIELLIMGIVLLIFICFTADFFATGPNILSLVKGLVIPAFPAAGPETTQVVALIGSVVMPHNLFLHSSLISKKSINRLSVEQIAQAIKYFVFDAVLALTCSFLINLSLQASFAQGFFSPVCAANPTGPLGCDPTLLLADRAIGCDLNDCSCMTPRGLPGMCSQIGLSNAGSTLSFITPGISAVLFGLGLLAAGQASTLSGTMAGQFVMEGFLELKVPFFLRMLITRGIALVPALAAALAQSEFTGMNNLSQCLNVMQSVQLPFALLPLVRFCSSRGVLGTWRVGAAWRLIGWSIAVGLIGVNVHLVVSQWIEQEWHWRYLLGSLSLVYLGVIGWMMTSDVCLEKDGYHRMHNNTS